MATPILKIDTVRQYNELFGVETHHPLVSVIDMSKARRMRHGKQLFGFYAVFLKEVKCGDLIYGRHYYDYQEGTLVCLAPGQVIGIEDNGEEFQPKGWALIFHPDLISGTPLGKNIKQYTFFSYKVNEALHLSEQERQIVVDCLRRIKHELQHAVDRHSKTLVSVTIELLLDYCVRFYERQFVTRVNVNEGILAQFEEVIESYFTSNKLMDDGLPSVQYCAEQLHLSANYFGDLIKKETGRSPQQHIRSRLIDMAKDRLLGSSKSVGEIAYELGFKYPQHFSRFFKKEVGRTPNEYRNGN